MPKSEGGMGFKDLKAFNLAFLAKQGWRLTQNTKSLAHKVLKAKYFSNSNFLEAQIGKNLSYTWRSLMAAQEVFQRGLRRNIGNGSKTKIWADRWIPTPNSFMVASLRLQNFEGELVETFIDRESRGWDINAVKSVFLPFEAEAILSIPISPSLPEDALIWAWTKKGDFMVKSAYQVALKWLTEDRGKGAGGEESNLRRKKKFWKAILGLNCLSKVKLFMWRACKNILPTNYCLWRRKVSTNDECVFCGLSESLGHALWDCWMAEAVWKETKMVLPKACHPNCEFIDVIWKGWEDWKEIEWERLACTAWCIWKNRNAAKFEGKIKQAKELASEALALVKEFKGQLEAPRQRAPSRTAGWTPPRKGWYKVNVDGTVFEESGSCGIGVVTRNERGLLMGEMSKKLDLPLGALEVEAKAFEEGILLAGDLGLGKIVLEGDAKLVTDALAGYCSPSSSIQMIIGGIQRWSFNVQAWQVTHVCRMGNCVAHLMARNAKLVTDNIVWVEDTPPIIACQLNKDVFGLDFVSS